MQFLFSWRKVPFATRSAIFYHFRNVFLMSEEEMEKKKTGSVLKWGQGITHTHTLTQDGNSYAKAGWQKAEKSATLEKSAKRKSVQSQL